METFERHLLLTWIAVEREDNPRFTAFNEAAQRDWSTIVRNYGNAMMRPDLRNAADRVGLWMPMLDQAATNQQFYQANMIISLIQNELRALRPQYGIKHPADNPKNSRLSQLINFPLDLRALWHISFLC